MSLIDVISDHSNKNLQTVPDSVIAMCNLKMLYLENNEISALPDDFFVKLPKLTWLDLRRNKLTTIPIGVANHLYLETLLLQNNLIEELPNELGIVSNLKVLQVSGNPLSYPPRDVIEKGILYVCKYLKDQHLLTHPKVESEVKIEEVPDVLSNNEIAADQNRNEVSTVDGNKIRKDVKFMPVIDVKTLSGNQSHHNNVIANVVKRTHKITRARSKISLHSHLSWSNKNKSDRVQEGELKEIWLKRLRDILADQEKILQQERNLKALSKWRIKRKLEPTKEVNLKEMAEPPYDTDPKYQKMLTRQEFVDQVDAVVLKSKGIRRRSGRVKKVNMQELIDEVVKQMKYLQTQAEHTHSPRTDQDIAGKQIESIVKLHKKILELQTQNQRY